MRRTGMAVAIVAGLALAVGAGIAVSAQLGTAATQSPLFASLNGAREVSGGDSNGRGAFNATIDGGKICFGLSVANIQKPLAAHIHKAGAGKSGGVVLSLKHPGKGDPGSSSACTTIEPALANQIRNNPGGFYVNVHTEAFPDGAIRGQLFKSAGK
jgi:hypothetical protein